MSYHPYGLPTGQNPEQNNSQNFGRPASSLPQPLEPRPSLYSSYSDTATTARRPEAFRSPTVPNHRAQHQTLPGLKDILPDSQDRRRHGPHLSWDGQSRPEYYSHVSNDTVATMQGMHPPMALNTRHYYASSLDYRPRAFEVPILETTRVESHAPPPSAHSPYASYPDPTREYADTRMKDVQPHRPDSFIMNEVRTPCAPPHLEDQYQLSAAPGFRRPSNSPLPQANAENQRHYLGTQVVPGEGTFHIWEGGHRIPTHVDGEQVNPAWGLTKANKPRKRLALACLDCREKKIKCEPGLHSCLQCEKAKRPCRRAPGQTSQSSTPAASWQDASSPVRKNPSNSDPTPTTDRTMENETMTKRRPQAESPPSVPSKKHRSTSPVASVPNLATQPRKDDMPQTTPLEVTASAATGNSFMTSEVDPYTVEPEVTRYLVELYFKHINNAIYWLYPRRHFQQWLTTTASDKCDNEKMTLYALLAAASTFADPGAKLFGRQCARIAADAIKFRGGKYNVAAAHTNMFLAIYDFAGGRNEATGTYIGAAVQIIRCLDLYTEEGCHNNRAASPNARIEFGFSATQLIECKRRTLWACFLMDRLSGPRPCILKSEDIFLRLPCSESAYEQGTVSDATYFPNECLEPTQTLLTPASQIAPMAWLVLCAKSFGEVIDFVYRIQRCHSAMYRDAYERFYQDARNNLQGWSSRLPAELQYSEDNLSRSLQDGYVEAFVAMHSVHHMAHMKLNQCLRSSAVSEEITCRNIREANSHAQRHLRMMCAVQQAGRKLDNNNGGQANVALSTPYLGYVTLTAINIISAGGPESTLQSTLSLIDGAVLCLHELSQHWKSAEEQLRVCSKRFYEVQNTLTSGQKSAIGAWLGKQWGLDKSMEPAVSEVFTQVDDCIYGLGESTEAMQLYFKALAEKDEGVQGQQRGLRIV